MVEFDVIPYEDIVWGRKLGSGSFGKVHKGKYLGIDIAIKEIVASSEYDVHKYFEREWRIMRECRHPNIVLFLGLSQERERDGRVFIVSEYVPGGNLRQYILSARPFPWRLRMSFATDISRAVAYLHARKCIHRDLKGENLLITSNERIKVTDFGFARIASRTAEEMKRMTFCGTDGYMSPEIINGLDFDLPTDVFSLGIIFIEILSRKLVDSKTYIRAAPSFVPEEEEIRRRASPGCPPALIQLGLDCCQENPSSRPLMPEVLRRLREIELDVLAKSHDPTNAEHVGSVRLLKHHAPRAMPLFTPPNATKDTSAAQKALEKQLDLAQKDAVEDSDEDEEDAKIEQEALTTLAGLDLEGGGPSVLSSGYGTCRTARWGDRTSLMDPIQDFALAMKENELDKTEATAGTDASFSEQDEPSDSVITIRGTPTRDRLHAEGPAADLPKEPAGESSPDIGTSEIGTIPSLSSEVITKIPTKQEQDEKEYKSELNRIRENLSGTHRFTLVDKEASLHGSSHGKKISSFSSNFAFVFLQRGSSSASKCPVCQKRLGQRPALKCDDCEVVVHVKCSHAAQRNCTGGLLGGSGV